MAINTAVQEYKCPCCDAPLVFGAGTQQMKCEYCDNTFDLDTVKVCAESDTLQDNTQLHWEETSQQSWSDLDQTGLRSFVCDACGGELITDDHTAATFCPYCGNAAILPARVSGGVKPDGVIPFKTTKDDAEKAFLALCKGKPLLPKFFTKEQQIQKITGMYVPFWIYDCDADFNGTYKATRIHSWSDANYIYTKTDHYLLRRQADAAFSGIPFDGSTKMEDSFMESMEPFHYDDVVDFDAAYLSGYLADKYDVEAKDGENRIRQRVETSIDDQLQSSFLGYDTVIPTARQFRIDHSKAKYVLLPVWILNTKYGGKTYTFAMNGQTGKMTGSFPACPRKTAAWFCGIWAAATAIVSLIQLAL